MRQFELTVEGKKHLFQETKTRENKEIWIAKKDGDVDKTIGRDLGILNGAGFLPEERTGKYPAVDKNLEHGFWFATYNDKNLNVHCTGDTLQELIDNWNRRAYEEAR